MNRAANYISIAKKAGLIELGEANTGAAAREGKARLVILASDASANAADRARSFVSGRSAPLMTAPLTKTEIAGAAGKSECSVAAFTDLGIAASFAAALGDAPEWAECARELQKRLQRAKRRRSQRGSASERHEAGKKED